MNRTATPFTQKHLHNQAGGLLQVLLGPGTVENVAVFNASSETVFLLFFDLDAVPASDGAPTFAPVPIPPDGYYESDTRRGFSNGCYIGLSPTISPFAPDGTDVYLDAGGSY